MVHYDLHGGDCVEIQPKRSKKLLHTAMAVQIPWGAPQVEPIPVFLPRLPAAFCSARVAVVADVHLPDNAVRLTRLVNCVALQRPDAIFLPGDLTNSYTNFDASGLRRLAKALTAIAPCFAIPGNHELRLGREPLYGQILAECGMHYLCDSYAEWEKDGAALRLFGMGHRCPRPLAVSGQPAIALAHKPDYFSYYQKARWNLVVCGHAHGGQIRVRGRGLYAPGQGALPTYTDGVYREGGTTMVVSRGLGDSSIPLRIANPPHMPLLLLMPAETA